MWIAVALAVGLITYAGIQMIVNSANPGKSIAARGLIIQTLIALAIVFGSSLIVNETLKALAGDKANSEGVFRNFKCTSTSPNLGGEGLKKVVGGVIKLDKYNETGGSQNDKPTGATGIQSGTTSGPGSVIVGPAKLKVFKQGGDAPWAQKMYGSATYAESGCGPSTVATTLTALGLKTKDGKEITSEYIGRISVDNGFRIPKEGTAAAALIKFLEKNQERYFSASKFNVSVVHTWEKAQPALAAGNMVVINPGPSIFTSKGHITMLHGKLPNGQYGVYDSGLRDYYTVNQQQILGGMPPDDPRNNYVIFEKK